MTMGAGFNRENVKHFAEVFTPPQVTFEMMLKPEVRDVLEDFSKPVYDPFVGQGQFPATTLVLRMFYNVERLNERTAIEMLRTLYGNDIQEESVAECRAHMAATLLQAFEFFTGRKFFLLFDALPHIYQNFIVADSAELFKINEQEPPKKKKPPKESRQPTLF